jgi:hypothetical protein
LKEHCPVLAATQCVRCHQFGHTTVWCEPKLCGTCRTVHARKNGCPAML